MWKNLTLALSVVLGSGALAAGQQEAPPASPARLFEAGGYDAVVSDVKPRAEAGQASPEDVYWAAQSLVRLERGGEAVELLSRLGGGDEDAWRSVGQSASALVQGDQAGALQAATRATQQAPDLFFAHYQLGLVRHATQQWAQATTAFERALAIDGGAAYAHYYAGMSYNRLKQFAKMVTHLNRFVELAPNAPERDAVQQLLNVLKGMR